MKRVSGFPKMTEELTKELEAAARMDDADIDTSDIPEWTDEDYARAAELTALYEPPKRQIATKVDVDVLLWLKSGGARYQSRLNAILREAMLRDRQKGKAPRKREIKILKKRGASLEE